jgi:hypothetical protein
MKSESCESGLFRLHETLCSSPRLRQTLFSLASQEMARSRRPQERGGHCSSRVQPEEKTELFLTTQINQRNTEQRARIKYTVTLLKSVLLLLVCGPYNANVAASTDCQKRKARPCPTRDSYHNYLKRAPGELNGT